MAEYRVTVLYDDNTPNRRTYQVSLDGRDMGELGEQSMVSMKTNEGSHSLAIDFAGKLVTTRSINFREGQYLARVHLSHDRRNQLSIRVDYSGGGSSSSDHSNSSAKKYYAQSYANENTAQEKAPAKTKKSGSKALPVVIVLLVLALGAGGWYFFLRPAGILSGGGVSVTEVAASTGAASAELGGAKVEIQGAELAKAKSGKRAIVITYQWTNNSGSTLHGAENVTEQVFQNGVQLEPATVTGSKYDFSMKEKSVRSGATVTVQTAYELDGEKGTVEFELSDASGKSKTVAAKNYSLG